jgi:hypothetical protein
MSEISNFPAEIPAGLSFQATLAFADFPAPAWTVKAIIRGPQALDLTGTADGADHVFTADAATTGAWAPGQYWISFRATDGTQVREAGRQELRITPDMAQAGAGYDGRSEAEISLAAIDAVLAKRATIDQTRYRINNRELWRTPISELQSLRAFYAAKVRREKAKRTGAGGFGRIIPVRFS